MQRKRSRATLFRFLGSGFERHAVLLAFEPEFCMTNKRLTVLQKLLKQFGSYILFLKRFSVNLWARGSTKNC